MLRVMTTPMIAQMISTIANTTKPAIRINSKISWATSVLRLNTVDRTADTRVTTASSRSEVRPGVLQSNAGSVANQTTSVSNWFTGGGKAGAARVAVEFAFVGRSIPTRPRLGT